MVNMKAMGGRPDGAAQSGRRRGTGGRSSRPLRCSPTRLRTSLCSGPWGPWGHPELWILPGRPALPALSLTPREMDFLLSIPCTHTHTHAHTLTRTHAHLAVGATGDRAS